MKAYGLSLQIQRSLGARTDVTTEGDDPEDEANHIRITSRLDAAQLVRLTDLVEEHGWELEYSGWSLAAIPQQTKISAFQTLEVPEVPDVP